METGKVIRVVIVDDHTMLVDTLSLCVNAESDMKIVGTAGTGAGARRLVETADADVILLDHYLPDARGVALVPELKAMRPDAAIVILTGEADEDVILAAVEAGCSGFVTKDRPIQDVLGAIRMAAAGEALISPAMLARLLPRLGRGERAAATGLTPRERQILGMLAQGLPNPVIAERLFLSLNTVRNHVQNLIAKLNSHSKLEAVATAVRQGIIDFPR